MQRVVAGIIKNQDKILIAKRKSGKKFGSTWEFPGGKVELGETAETALKRELYEELGLEVVVGNFFAVNDSVQGEYPIRLEAYFIDDFQGTLMLQDHSEIAWVHSADLSNFQFAPADIPIAEKLQEYSTCQKN